MKKVLSSWVTNCFADEDREFEKVFRVIDLLSIAAEVRTLTLLPVGFGNQSCYEQEDHDDYNHCDFPKEEFT